MKFTLPYNNSDPEVFLKYFSGYEDYIDSFYFGMPGIFESHNPIRESFAKTIELCSNTYRFLELAKNKFKTILCLNTIVYPENYESVCFLMNKELGPLVEAYDVNAVNLASPTLAEIIHRLFPNLEIQTSCNTYSFINNMYYLWNEKFGTTVFNLPREAMRTPTILESFQKTGFKSKCIVNEGCIYGCPGNIEHACSFVIPDSAVHFFCDRSDFHLSDIFKSNFVPPHLLPGFNNKIDILKIAGRTFPSHRIFQIFKSYLDCDPEADVELLLHSRSRRYLAENKIHIKSKQWPKKTLTCECKECRTCNICHKAMMHAISKSGIDFADLNRPV